MFPGGDFSLICPVRQTGSTRRFGARAAFYAGRINELFGYHQSHETKQPSFGGSESNLSSLEVVTAADGMPSELERALAGRDCRCVEDQT